jgi:hypothetical protein
MQMNDFQVSFFCIHIINRIIWRTLNYTLFIHLKLIYM